MLRSTATGTVATGAAESPLTVDGHHVMTRDGRIFWLGRLHNIARVIGLVSERGSIGISRNELATLLYPEFATGSERMRKAIHGRVYASCKRARRWLSMYVDPTEVWLIWVNDYQADDRRIRICGSCGVRALMKGAS